MTRLAVINGVNPYLAIAAGDRWSASPSALLNGGLITRVRLPPFIVTLGTLNIAFAITHIYSQNQTITNLPGRADCSSATHSRSDDTSITYGTVLMFILYLITWYVLRQTAVGRHVYAVGNNPEAARLSGINTLTLAASGSTPWPGCFYGIAALLLVAPHRTSAIRTRDRRIIWQASRRWCSVVPACSAAAEAIMGTLDRRADRRRVSQRPAAHRASNRSIRC